MGEKIEQKAFVKTAKELLCLAYAYDVKKQISNFTCIGSKENQPNQLVIPAYGMGGLDLA